MEHWSSRQRRWFAIGIGAAVLAVGTMAARAGADVVILGAVIVAPFAVAAASARTAAQTLAGGVATLVGTSYAVYAFSPGKVAFLAGIAAALLLRWDTGAQLIARFLAVSVAAVGISAHAGYGLDAELLLFAATIALVAVGLADEVADLFAGESEVELGELARRVDLFPRRSLGQKLSMISWGSLLLALMTFVLGYGYDLGPLLVLVAIGAGLAGAVAAFSTRPAEGEVRAATFAMSVSPVLLIVGVITAFLWALSTAEWNFP